MYKIKNRKGVFVNKSKGSKNKKPIVSDGFFYFVIRLLLFYNSFCNAVVFCLNVYEIHSNRQLCNRE